MHALQVSAESTITSGLQVLGRDGARLGRIRRQDFTESDYNPEAPWLLIYERGRIERFATKTEARLEAMKSWAGCHFKKSG